MNGPALLLTASLLWPITAAHAQGAAGLNSSASGTLSDRVYYAIGGGTLMTPPSSMNTPSSIGMGARFNGLAMCSRLDMKATVTNSLNGTTEGFKSLWTDITGSLSSAVAGLPALILKRSNPDLYDLLNNGVLQARMDFDKSELNCERLSERIADISTDQEWKSAANAETLREAIATGGGDAVSSMRKVKQESGDQGLKWLGGETRGGRGQPPVQVTHDTMQAGYNILNARPVNDRSPVSPSACSGGLCRTWNTPEQAAQFMQRVVGDQQIHTCDNCPPSQSTAGTGLTPVIQEEQDKIAHLLRAMLTGQEPIDLDNLGQVSGGSLRVTRNLMSALAQDPDREILLERLSGELALVRVLEQSVWAMRALRAGMHEPNIANVKEAGTTNDRNLATLEREIDLIKTELELRRELSNNTATNLLERLIGRQKQTGRIDPLDPETERVENADTAREVRK